jgi:acetoin utilization protein AcuB
MQVRDIMSRSVRSIPPNLDTAAARHLMRSARVRHLVVVDGERVVGVVSQRDLGGTRQEALPAGRVDRVMSARVVVVEPDATVKDVANLMRGHGIGCLPVVEGKQLVGIVTTSDLLALIGEAPVRPKRLKLAVPRSRSRGARVQA